MKISTVNYKIEHAFLGIENGECYGISQEIIHTSEYIPMAERHTKNDNGSKSVIKYEFLLYNLKDLLIKIIMCKNNKKEEVYTVFIIQRV